ncbi:DNA-binding protein [Neopusillimonas aromaticivorans]|uniref:DNA-binding protein n=1 Tax=Neopusillimonas aromaticivorans TaxID=2979868 RepID=UPI002598CB3A|nr:DNA-binding protein [Neopusillimonas aromaticivorans]WJJ93428.1 DNA-binding protein [Neopusillimonas aromaticivorans]
MSDEVLFKSAADALRFAFNYSHQQYDRPMMNRLATAPVGEGKGLAGQDGAGQAGMILSRLERLPNMHRAVLAVRFGPMSFPCSCGSACCSEQRRNLAWEAAAGAVGAYAAEAIPGGAGRYRLRTELVRRFYGASGTLADVAEKVGVSLRTVASEAPLVEGWLNGYRSKETKKWVMGVDVVAIRAAEALLSESGFIESKS